MSSVWVYQDDKQVKKHGEAKASWYVGWIDPKGKKRCKSCGPGTEGARAAERLRQKRQAELLTGTYEDLLRASWEDFRKQYDTLILSAKGAGDREQAEAALTHFERIINPKRVATINAADLALFIAKRRAEPGCRKGSLVSPATINKDLRYLRSMLRKARRMGYIKEVPEFDFVKEPKRLPSWVPPEHLAKMYDACEAAPIPVGQPYPAADWWRGFLVFAYMTGWRVGSILALRRADVDLAAGTALSGADDNKGGRDQFISLHPLVIEHLGRLPSFGVFMFPWPHGRRQMYEAFEAIQTRAGVKPARGKERYGFHDLRRAFATLNAGRLSADVLQALMQHRSYTTTQRYIDLARQMRPAAHDVFVPDVGGAARAR